MAYVEWHDTVRNHYKTDDLMRRLKNSLGRDVTRREAVGIIGCISSWAIQFRPGGLIERNLIAVAVEWTEDPEKLVDALIKAEWLDRKGPKVAVHDWVEITRGYRKARKDAARRSRARSAATAPLQPRSDPIRSELNELNERRGEESPPLADLEIRSRLTKAVVASKIPNKAETIARYVEAWVAQKGVDEVLRILVLPTSMGKDVIAIQDEHFKGAKLSGTQSWLDKKKAQGGA